MSQALAVAEPILAAVGDNIQKVVINVDFAGNVSVDNPFVQVPQDETLTIYFDLESELPNVFFDTPGFTLTGQQKPGFDVNQPSSTAMTVTWPNTTNDQFGQSFFYRVHLLQQIGSTFRPLILDPIIHNDPPPLP